MLVYIAKFYLIGLLGVSEHSLQINIQLKSEVYIHLCQVYLNKARRLFVLLVCFTLRMWNVLIILEKIIYSSFLSTHAHANCSLAIFRAVLERWVLAGSLSCYVYIGLYVYCGCLLRMSTLKVPCWNLFALYTTNYVWRHV